MKVPSCSSAYARRSSSGVFITMGPYHATGSSIGFPDTSRNRIPASPAWTVTASPLSNSTSDRFSASPAAPPPPPPPAPPAPGGYHGSHAFGTDGTRLRGVTERATALEHVGERVPGRLDRQRLALPRRDPHVQIARIRCHPLDRAGLPPKAPADHPDARAVVVGDLRDGGGRDVLVARPGHLQGGREIRPQLEAMHAPPWVPARHLLMQDPAARGHPLHVTRSESSLVSEAVAVVDGPREDVRDRFDPPMGVPGEPREVILRVLVAKVVEQEERIELLGVAEAESAAQPHAGALDGRLCLHNTLDGSNRHVCSPESLSTHLCRTPAGALRFPYAFP